MNFLKVAYDTGQKQIIPELFTFRAKGNFLTVLFGFLFYILFDSYVSFHSYIIISS